MQKRYCAYCWPRAIGNLNVDDLAWQIRGASKELGLFCGQLQISRKVSEFLVDRLRGMDLLKLLTRRGLLYPIFLTLHLSSDIREGNLGARRNKQREYCAGNDETTDNTIKGKHGTSDDRR